jgi:hypothetical protein
MSLGPLRIGTPEYTDANVNHMSNIETIEALNKKRGALLNGTNLIERNCQFIDGLFGESRNKNLLTSCVEDMEKADFEKSIRAHAMETINTGHRLFPSWAALGRRERRSQNWIVVPAHVM